MTSYIIRRLLLMFPTLIGIVTITFIATQFVPGGPIDQTPPRIASTQPATDQTSVATDAAIQIDFSEPMDRRTTQEAIFVAPATDFEMDWEGSATLRLKLAQGLAQDRIPKEFHATGFDVILNPGGEPVDFTDFGVAI